MCRGYSRNTCPPVIFTFCICLQDADCFSWGHVVPDLEKDLGLVTDPVPWVSDRVNEKLTAIWHYIMESEVVSIEALKELCLQAELVITKDRNDANQRSASKRLSQLTNEGSSQTFQRARSANKPVS